MICANYICDNAYMKSKPIDINCNKLKIDMIAQKRERERVLRCGNIFIICHLNSERKGLLVYILGYC